MSRRMWSVAILILACALAWGASSAPNSHAAPRPVTQVNTCPAGAARLLLEAHRRPSTTLRANTTREVDALANKHGKRLEDHDLANIQARRNRRSLRTGKRGLDAIRARQTRRALRARLDAMGCAHLPIHPGLR